ncbi:hypothetical protein CJU90_0724 [Yarrowia sp. C11]|nr:hypothetical protein CKK34_2136 [Yarrowia sp. E02]KAG5373057.1 hypothetical protein CJU90_0724 [Yarrowia sp. C11]
MEFQYSIVADKKLLKPLAEALLSSILFHRLFGSVTPDSRELLNITYPHPLLGTAKENQELAQLLDENASLLSRSLENGERADLELPATPTELSRAKQTEVAPVGSVPGVVLGETDMTVQFFEKRTKKSTWFGKNDDKLWEQWRVSIRAVTCRSDVETEKMRGLVQQQLQSILMAMAADVNGNKDHIPPITTVETSPFPYKVAVSAPRRV